MTWSHLHNEEAPNVGDPDDEPIGKLAGVAPPCDSCGKKPQSPETDGSLCSDCAASN